MALLSALCVVLRLQFSFWGNVQPITAIFLVATIWLSLLEGVLIMAVTMLVTSFMLGFGIWVPLQILSFGLVLLLWHQLFPLIKEKQLLQILVAGLLAFLYGGVIDSLMAGLYGMPWWSYVAAGATFNVAHALSTALFYPLIMMIFRRIYHEKTV